MFNDTQAALNSPNFPAAAGSLPPLPHLPFPVRSPNSSHPVRVACHRGDWRNYVENTLEAVESCIQMGADIVEVDVWETSDGELILMHDPTLDRTSSGTGLVADHTLAEIRSMRLKDGLGNMTEFTIPTVEEVLRLAHGRVVVNLDKADVYMKKIYDLLVKTDMVGQTIVKSETSYEELCKIWGGDLMERVFFMPIVSVTNNTTPAELDHVFAGRHPAYEVNFEQENLELLRHIQKLAQEQQAVLWINTIWPTTCGGHSDDHALLRNKDENWGYVVRQLGAGILQTDRPALMLNYLQEQHLR